MAINISALNQVIELHPYKTGFIAYTKSSIYSCLNNNVELITNIPSDKSGSIKVGSNHIYFISGDVWIYSLELKTWSRVNLYRWIANGIVLPDGRDIIYTIDEGGGLSTYDPQTKKWERRLYAPIQGFKDVFWSGLGLSGENVLYPSKWRAKDLKQSREAVWALLPSSTTSKDVTQNLGVRNMTGTGFGPLGQLVIHGDFNYQSTEEGVFRKPINTETPTWEQVISNWGNLNIRSFNKELFGTIGDKGFGFYRNNTWESYPHALGNVRECVAVNNNPTSITIYGIKEGVIVSTVIELKTAASITSQATFTGLGTARCAAKLPDNNLMVALGNKEVLICRTDRTLIKLTDLPVVPKSIATFGTMQVAAGEGQLIAITPDGRTSTALRSRNTSPTTEVVSASGDWLAYLNNTQVSIFNRNFQATDTINEKGVFVTDVAVYDRRVYTAGYRNGRNPNDNNNPVQVAFLRCYRILPTGKLALAWTSWNFNPATLKDNMADTRLYKVIANQHGLAVLGESAGGNTIFRSNGKILDTNTLVRTDLYDDATGNVKDAHFLYYALLNPVDGKVIRGQFAIPRLTPNMRSNTNRARSIAFSADGKRLHLGSLSAFQLPNRDFTKFLGQTPPPYSNGDASLLSVEVATFKDRNWVTPGHGDVVYHSSDFVVINSDAPLYTSNASIPKAGGDSYIVFM